ncbi:MAG: hypothetical protein EHM70_08845 [Chloroflexota bacterium]|nr:MAG: hypothetical protein EHM70_08845 [Chloroflexota bacterium]
MKRLTPFLLLTAFALVVNACSPGASLEAAVQATLAALPVASPYPTQTPYPTLLPNPTAALTVGAGVFFDDFTYTGPDDPRLSQRGWTVRTQAGGPGVPGAQWPLQGVSFVEDGSLPGNWLAQLASSTSGSPETTNQAELFQQRKFYEGTYASRVRFSDEPEDGPDGDQIVETFFTITPLNYDMDPDYGEIDFEYLPNGGWGASRTMFWMTTWETYRPDPWEAVNDQDSVPISFEGWHTLVAQVGGAKVRYYIDGSLLAGHGDQFFPETPMSINYNLWFIAGGLDESSEKREYIEQIDWLYYAGNEALSPGEVEQRVDAYRASQVPHVDQVPGWVAPPVVVPPTPTASVAGPRPFEATIHKVSGIVVDGKLDDWLTEPTFTINDRSQVVYLAGGEKWEGPGDLSALAWVGWAAEGLYLAFDVTDNVIVQDNTGADIWQGDYMEVQLDTQMEQDYSDHNLSADDFQFGFTPGDFGIHPASVHVWQGPVSDEQMSQIQQAQTETEAGYVLEVFVPIDLLPGLALEAGATLGLNINPSDADSPEIPQRLMMSTSPIRLRTDPTTLGKLILSE